MTKTNRRLGRAAAVAAFFGLGVTDVSATSPALTPADCDAIIAAAKTYATTLNADFRPGAAQPRFHYACVNKAGSVVGFQSDWDAWQGSRDVAKAKAYTAMAFSSNQNALTTRTIFCAIHPGGPLWELGNANQGGAPKTTGSINQLGIIQFPGGVPIYKDGKLVGGFGVSGDSIGLDEKTAFAGVAGNFEASDTIKSSTVIGVAYTLDDFGGNCTK
jgi:uncharacterized protein GlcG (DUF336 family)